VRQRVALFFRSVGTPYQREQEMKDVKVLTEELESLKIEAKAIPQACKISGREMNDDEVARFDELTKTQIPEKQKELARAQEVENQIVALSIQEDRQRRLAALESEDPTVSRPRVLPTNGVMPEEERGSDRIYVRSAKLKAFKNERDAFNSGMWLRAIVAREFHRTEDRVAIQHCRLAGLEVTNTSHEGSGPSGGYLVPAPISSTIIDVRENTGVARRVCDIQPMTSDTLTIPKRAGGLTVYYPGETAAITPSDKTWSQVELIAKKRAVAAYISQELVDDSLINIVDNVVSEMGYALALQEDNELINGTGAASYGGVRGLLNRIGSSAVATAATGHDTWPELDIADFTACIGLLPDRFNRSPAWICSSNFYHTAMLKVLASAGGNTIASLTAGAGGTPTFLGYPVYFTSQMPTSTAAATVCALFGSFSMGVLLGDRVGIRIGRDDSTQFLSDMTTLKATARYDINIHQPGTASVVGAYTALKTAS